MDDHLPQPDPEGTGHDQREGRLFADEGRGSRSKRRGPLGIRYHITLKMLFFDTDGSVSAHFSHRFDSITWTEHGADRGHGDYCPASLDTGP